MVLCFDHEIGSNEANEANEAKWRIRTEVIATLPEQYPMLTLERNALFRNFKTPANIIFTLNTEF